MAKDRKYCIGFDLGGTKMLSAVLDDRLEIKVRLKEKFSDKSSGDTVLGSIVGCINNSLKEAGLKPEDLIGIGIGVPGPIDRKKGVVKNTPNLGFTEYPLRDRLEKAIGVPVLLENDVNVGTFGEFVQGAAKGYRHVLGIFPGTGIGGGLIIDGKLFLGATGNAGEIGHMIIQVDGRLCGCGQYGCVEALASRTALAKDAAALAASGDAPTVLERAGTDLMKIRSSVLGKAVDAGEKPIKRLVDRSAYFLGVAMANAVNLLSPEVIVLGGGLVDRFGKAYVEAAERSMREHAMPSVVEGVKVIEAALGDDAAVIGAAALVLESAADSSAKR